MTTKTCNKCHIEKDISEYYKNSSRKDGYNYTCKKCQMELNDKNRRESQASWKRINKNRKLITRYKMFCGCKICGYKGHPAALDLNHRDPEWKKANRKATDGAERYSAVRPSWGIKRIREEIRQCDVLCANCHRIHTHGEHFKGY